MRCPNCGSYHASSWRDDLEQYGCLLVLMLPIVPFILLMIASQGLDRSKCHDCGYEWGLKSLQRNAPSHRERTPEQAPRRAIEPRTGQTTRRIPKKGVVLGVTVIIVLGVAGFFGLQNYQIQQRKESLYLVAVGSLQTGKWQEARNSLQELSALDGNYKDAQTLMRETFYRPAKQSITNRDWGHAEEELEALMGFDSNYRDARLLLRDVYYSDGVDNLRAGGDKARAKNNLLRLLDQFGSYRDALNLLTGNFQVSKMPVKRVQASGSAMSNDASESLRRGFENALTYSADGSIATAGTLGYACEARDYTLTLSLDLGAPAVVTGIRYYVASPDNDIGVDEQLKELNVRVGDQDPQNVQLPIPVWGEKFTARWVDIQVAPSVSRFVNFDTTKRDAGNCVEHLKVVEVEVLGIY